MENEETTIIITPTNVCCICLETDSIEKYKLWCCQNEIHMSCLETLAKHNVKKSNTADSIPIECPLCRKIFAHATLKANPKDTVNKLTIIAKILILLLFIIAFGPFCYEIITASINR